MVGTSLAWRRAHENGSDYTAVKQWKNHPRRHQTIPQRYRIIGSAADAAKAASAADAAKAASAALPLVPEKRSGFVEPAPKPLDGPASSLPAKTDPSCNLSRFLESTTPSVPAHYPPKRKMRACRRSHEEFRPFFNLADLWEAFKEWSAYGIGVPFLLSGRDKVVQYYVPFLSGIQLYGRSSRPALDARELNNESDVDSHDSSSDGSSEYESEKGLNYSNSWISNHMTCGLNTKMNRLHVNEQQLPKQDGSSSDDDDLLNLKGHLLFEFLEQDPPFIREPLADKISDLARHFPALKSLRSCDLLPASWFSVAWYPIYRIPTGPTLKDLDACFLTFHSLSTSAAGDAGSACPGIPHAQEVDVHMMHLPIFGLASYKFKSSFWTPNGETELPLAKALLLAADNWLRLRHVDHPDFQFFVSRGAFKR